MDNYDYTTAGLDAFLSRSIDNTPQANLDSGGSSSTQLRWDSSQLSGGIGDSFGIGGMRMSGKENTFVLNDGTLHINDSATNTSMQASSGNIAYYDGQNSLVVQEGVLNNGATGIRIVDRNQIGIAQFGRDKDGVTSLKIAKSNVEVTSASADQLIFNSNQDVFKIVKTDTITGPSYSTAALTNQYSQSSNVVTIAHGLTTTPIVLSYIFAGSSYIPLPYSNIAAPSGTQAFWASYTAESDDINIYFRVTAVSYNQGNSSSGLPIKYYLLQETAN